MIIDKKIHSISTINQIFKYKLNIKEHNIPPQTPSIIFLGYMNIDIICVPNFLPIKNEQVSLVQMIIKVLKIIFFT